MQRYEAYKDSGVEWIGEIPEGWEVAKFGLYSTVHSGIAFQGEVSEEKQVPIFGGGNVIGYSDVSNVDSPALIVGRVGGNEPSYFDCSIWATDNALVIDTSIDKKYAYYSLLSADLSSMATSTSQPLLTGSKVRSLRVPVPASCEQQAIADYLDGKTAQIDSIVSQTERSIELLREYRKSVISEAVTKGLDPDAPMRDSGVEWIGEIPVGWERDKVFRLFDSIGSGTTPKSDNLGYYDGDIPWIQSGDLGSGPLRSTQKTITQFAIESLSSLSVFKAPFLVIAMYGASIGSMALSTIDACTNQACCVLAECKGSLSFFEYVLSAAKQHLIDQGIGGTQPNISQQLIKALWLPVPPLPEQQAIADYLDAKTAEIDSLIADKQRQVELLKEYRKSLTSEAVTGKFKVPGLE